MRAFRLTLDTQKFGKWTENDEMNVSMSRTSMASTSSKMNQSTIQKPKSTTSSRLSEKKQAGPRLEQGPPLEPLGPWNYKKLEEIKATTQSQVSTVLQYSSLFPFLQQPSIPIKPSMIGKSSCY
jgi:hypothetical protein